MAVCDLSEEGVGRVVEGISTEGGRATPAAVDVTRPADLEQVMDKTVSSLGGLDILVNSAGVTRRSEPEGLEWHESWQRVIDVNLKGTYMACKLAVDRMLEASGGSIVNIASAYGLVGRPAALSPDGLDPYTHSKGGVVQLTRELGVRYAQSGIRVNCVCPGFANTALTEGIRQDPEGLERLESLHPIGRLAEPEEIANAILFLASDEASYFIGSIVAVDGGYIAQ